MNTHRVPCTGQGAQREPRCLWGTPSSPKPLIYIKGGLGIRHCRLIEWLCHNRKRQQQKQTEISLWSLPASCTPGPLRTQPRCHLSPPITSPTLPVIDLPPPHCQTCSLKNPRDLFPAPCTLPDCSALLHLLTTLLTRPQFPSFPGSAVFSPPMLPPPTLAALWIFFFYGPSVTGTQDVASAILMSQIPGPSWPLHPSALASVSQSPKPIPRA